MLTRSPQRAHLTVTTTVDGTAGPHDLIVVEQGTFSFGGGALDPALINKRSQLVVVRRDLDRLVGRSVTNEMWATLKREGLSLS